MLEPNGHERRVVLGEVPHDEAVGQLREMSNKAFEGIEDAVPVFQKVDAYTTFSAEYSWIEGDLVIHFFLPPEQKLPFAKKYWLEHFPFHLDAAARSFFSAEFPRLVGRYTEELESWWFKAHGYGHVLDTDAYAIRFLKALDQAIEAGAPTDGSVA